MKAWHIVKEHSYRIPNLQTFIAKLKIISEAEDIAQWVQQLPHKHEFMSLNLGTKVFKKSISGL